MLDQPKAPIRSAEVGREQSPWALAGLGTQFFVALVAFGYAGNWIDARLGLSPLFLLVGVFVGGGGTFFVSYRRLMKKIEDAEAVRARPSVVDTSR
jgi:hypothetical protein